MCGRYALALRPSQVRQMLRDEHMEVHDAPADDEGPHAPRQSYNFAPGYHGIVYRADVPDYGAGPRREAKSKGIKATTTDEGTEDTAADAEPAKDVTPSPSSSPSQTPHYKLQSMKWGLIPFWTKRNPDYGAMMKTINCRADSLAQPGGMWASMKGRKRCVVLAQGFYEWLKVGPREKVPHYVRRTDGKLMCFAGLWDCVRYENEGGEGAEGGEAERNYTYTIITTESNKQLNFLHDRMPVILEPASEELKVWLDPGRWEWSTELQGLLKPFEGELEVYPVSKEVGKVGNNSPSFIIPIASRENKSNIANFFANAQAKSKKGDAAEKEVEVEVDDKADGSPPAKLAKTVDEVVEEADDGGMGVSSSTAAGAKRKGDEALQGEEPPLKKEAVSSSPVKAKPSPSPSKPSAKTSKTRSATSNGTKSPSKGKGTGTQKITKFFGNSA